MNVFSHHLYEYDRGLRRLVLHTTKSEYRDAIIAKLKNRGISYIIKDVNPEKINVFFGADYCISVLQTFPDLDLRNLTLEQDFILGAMLGYDMEVHCKRYLGIINKQQKLKAV
ncbi:MAG: DUF2023 family protein [Spirochaetales bacterium]|nr:DUF2023 family protein [Spirochaetales bacterium]